MNTIPWCRRIIPARAGFTRYMCTYRTKYGDHPRSRGVYPDKFMSLDDETGSSPLARGLPSGVGGSGRMWGIIPARAGFTQYIPERHLQPADHPRSRGVYCGGRSRSRLLCGSSPLARGLLCNDPPKPAASWIIPARAGFTALLPAAGRLVEDHPRSRGVYFSPRWRASPRFGSSPLARGLQCAARRDRHGRGIIPARAGFTLLRDARLP